ncbi:distal tail protein Dit [Virgibacillus sp. CBA3643]|uniref:distal tail protein Dit n=1 Tax=Virgibacillus sp. CBA3643 TaxID=2942278 RepID=UPI0035A38A45
MLKYDGFDLSNYLLVEDIGRPLLPPQTLETMSIYGRRGAYFLENQDDPITIPVDVTIYEQQGMTYRELTRFLAEKLNKSEPKQLIFEDEPNLYIDGILDGSTELETTVRVGQGTLNFYCPDPSYYAIEDEILTYNGTGDYNFTREKGNTESYPLIEIEGENSNGTITIATDNTEINFEGDLSSGEVLVFDSDLITSYILQTDGEQRSANNDIDTMDFPIFQVGANNINISASGATVNDIRIYLRSRWK